MYACGVFGEFTFVRCELKFAYFMRCVCFIGVGVRDCRSINAQVHMRVWVLCLGGDHEYVVLC